jgi:hypothetical protein
MATAKKSSRTTKPAQPRTTASIPPAEKAAAAKKPVATKPAQTAKAPKEEKPKKPKLVRDSFTIPKVEYVVLEALKVRAAKLGTPAKKSELLRAGIKLLAATTDSALASALAAVPAIKTGRPSKD